MRLIDLHTHTTASDGTFTPSELAAAAKTAGLSACAVTDHDTVSGVNEFLCECKKQGIEGIPGIELSAEYEKQMHIVGLYIDYKNKAFLDKLYFAEHSREIRNRKMLHKCVESGLEITAEELISLNSGGGMMNIGRPHFANLLVKKGYADTLNDAFEKYLKRGCPCYVKREMFSPKETIEMIKSANGTAILAHPIFISRERSGLKALLTELRGYGLDGTECLYSEYDDEFVTLISGLCDELGLIKSGGSDFHGSNKPHIALGKGNGSLAIPYEYLEAIKKSRLSI